MTEQEIKNNYAKSVGYENFTRLLWDCGIFEIESHYEKVIQLVAQQALENASENFRESFLRTENIHKAITNPNNIPTI